MTKVPIVMIQTKCPFYSAGDHLDARIIWVEKDNEKDYVESKGKEYEAGDLVMTEK